MPAQRRKRLIIKILSSGGNFLRTAEREKSKMGDNLLILVNKIPSDRLVVSNKLGISRTQNEKVLQPEAIDKTAKSYPRQWTIVTPSFVIYFNLYK